MSLKNRETPRFENPSKETLENDSCEDENEDQEYEEETEEEEAENEAEETAENEETEEAKTDVEKPLKWHAVKIISSFATKSALKKSLKGVSFDDYPDVIRGDLKKPEKKTTEQVVL